jgi:hypothetical protein
MTNILAGNVVHIDRTFTRIGTGTVTSSTAAVAVTDPAGVDTALPATVAVDNTAGTVHVAADWAIADPAPAGWYTITIDVAGGMVAAWQGTVYVRARTLAVVP